MEAVKKTNNKGGITGGGPKKMKRVPREVIHEEAPERPSYSNMDERRFKSQGGNALAGTKGEGGIGRSFDFLEVKEENSSTATPDSAPLSQSSSLLSKYKFIHKCQGCATGICRSRKLPISGVQDSHDGDTVSTSGSIMTDSEIDKAEFMDVDFDFEEWEDEDGVWDNGWVTVGDNGKELMG